MWNIISSNKLIDKQMKQKERQRHIKKVKNIKATMKISQPFKPDFLLSKTRHSALRTQIQQQIDYKNQILLEHMRIIQQKSQDYWRNKQRATNVNLQCRKRLSQMVQQSRKIDEENQIIGRRLTNIHSEYQGISSLHLANSRSKRLFSASKSRPLSGTTILKRSATQNTIPDYDQFRNTENLQQMVTQYDFRNRNTKNKIRCKSGYQRRIFTQNVQYF